ncbi:MAG: hypothetical protein AAFQ41_10675, partial [Cyanobacteria bacterium J06623_7]
LISTLKLDWLTRNIPILTIGDSLRQKSLNSLNYDAHLTKPYSLSELEQTICSLVCLPACKI